MRNKLSLPSGLILSFGLGCERYLSFINAAFWFACVV
jgi:hypothetical protein